MRRDVTRKAPGGLPNDLGILSLPRWPSLWLAAVLGGLLLLAFVFARVTLATSHTAFLDNLQLTDVTLDPRFTEETEAYTATVLDAVKQTTVTAPPADADDEVTITPDDADADEDGHQVDLGIGETEITVMVDSGATTKTYTVTVTRIAANDASLTALSLGEGIDLSPEFDAGTTSYTASVPNDIDAGTGDIQSAISVTATPVAGARVQLITPGTFTAGAAGAEVTATAIDLTVETATLITVTVVAADTTQQKYTVTVTRAASDDATLLGLTLTGATLAETFADDTTEYTSAVATDVERITIVGTANNGEAKVSYSPADAVPDDDDDTTTDDADHQVDLGVGETVITVTVTAGDGSTQDYTVTVTRAGPALATDATLATLTLSSDLTLTPAFEAATDSDTEPHETSYTASAPYDLDTGTADVENQITVTATAVSGATLGISPDDVDEDAAEHQVDLKVGSNTITVKVTHGLMSRTYTVTVTRIANNDASLSALSLGDDIELSSKFAAGRTSYTASVPNDLDADAAGVQNQITVTATAVAGARVGLITPDDDTDASNGAMIDLAVGDTLITVAAVAADGTTQRDYTVTVTRAASDVATLSSLTLSDITDLLMPDNDPFDGTVTAYTAEVGNDVESTTVAAEATANAGLDADAQIAKVVISPDDAVEDDANEADTTGHQVDLDVGETTITVTVTAEDESTQSYTVTVTRAELGISSDSTLSELSLDGITLDPVTFNTAITAYEASVDKFVTSTAVTAMATDDGASVTITPADADAADGHQVNLELGENTISVIVASSDGTTTTTYMVTVLRAYGGATLSELELSGVTLTPAFSADVTSYAGSVASDVLNTTVAVKAVAGAETSIEDGDGVDISDADGGEEGLQAALVDGDNTINVVVTSSDGTARTTYSVSVFKVHATANLAALSLGDDVALSPDFAAGTTSYTANVDYSTMQVTVAGTPVTDASMAVQDADGMAIEDADADADGHQVNLDLGANTIVVAVTAGTGDDAVTTTYTVVVTRGAASDAALSALSLGGITLNPAFDPDTTTYSANVANDVVSTTVMATVAHADATVDAPAGQIDLAEGANSIVVTVTAEDGTTTMTYTVVVARARVEIVTVEGPGVTVSPLAALIEGETGSFNVSLHTAPTADVTIAVSSDNAAAVVVGADANTGVLTLTFTATDYMSSQTVMVMGAVDDDTEHARATISLAVTSADMDYQGLDKTVAVFVADNTVVDVPVAEGVASLVVSSLASVKEGESGSITVSLNTAPTAAVTIAVSSENADVTVEPMSLTFTVDDFATAQTVTVAASEDDDSDHGSAVISLVASSTDTDYEGKGRTVTVFVADNDPVEVEVEVPGPTVTQTRTITRTVTVTAPAPPAPMAPMDGVIGNTASATATLVDGRVVITRHDGGATLAVNLGGFIRDESLGQTYQVVRRMDGMIVRQWVSPNSPLVYQIPWAVVNSEFSVPVGVIGAIPLDDQSGAAGQLVRRFDGGDDRIFSYDGMGGWRHVPDIPTFQALGLYWCDVTAADAGFFDRITIGSPHPATDMPARSDYPSCSTG